MSVVIEVTRDLHPRFMRHGTLSSDVEPAITDVKPVKPILDHIVCDLLITPVSQCTVAALGTPQRPTRAVDTTHGLVLQVLAIQVGEVRLLLAQQGIDSTLDDTFGRSDADLFGLGKRNQDCAVDKADRGGSGLACFVTEVVVPPASVDRCVCR